MKYILTTLLLAGFFLNVSAQKVKTKKVKFKDGYYETYEYIKVDKQIIKHGKYYKKSSPYEVEGQYVNGKRHGTWTYNGYKKGMWEFYVNGRLDSLHRIEGRNQTRVVYHNNGDSVVTNSILAHLGNNIKITIRKDSSFYYNSDGSLRGLKTGGLKEGKWTYKLANKQYSIVQYRRDTIVGLAISYRADGSVIRTYRANNKGDLNGNDLYLSKSGDTIALFPYVHGKLQGTGWTKYDNGNIRCKVEYDSGRIKNYIEYYESGAINKESNVSAGSGVIIIDSSAYGSGKYDITKGHYESTKVKVLSNKEVLAFLERKSKPEVQNDNKPGVESLPATFTTQLIISIDSAFSPSTSPQYAGQKAYASFDRFIHKNMKIKDICYEECPSGTILVSFKIDENGEVVDLETTTS